MSKSTVYTSFDGDHMIYIDYMRELAIKNGFIPINPEHALGYYLSTRAHGDSKFEVMRDCLSLTMASDEFWVFAEKEDMSLDDLSEGVLIEMLLWIRQKNNSIRVFSISKTVENLKYSKVLSKYQGQEYFIEEMEIEKALGKRFFDEISFFLTNVVPKLRQVVFVDIRDEDFKYVDWVRARAYEVGKVPIVSQHLIPEVIYTIHEIEDYLDCVDRLKDVATNIWVIYESQEKLNVLREVYEVRKSKVTFISIKDLNVPKYANPKKWSITSKELRENLQYE